jgi:hypothetical protein
MSDDLVTSLRALAAAQHSDLTVAADAADMIERLNALLKEWECDCEHYCYSFGGPDLGLCHRYLARVASAP